jgi:hypothetical protein
MFKKKKNRDSAKLMEDLMQNDLNKEMKLQQRLQQSENKRIAQMEKIEQKKQILLEKQLKKKQEREMIIQTKLALKEEQIIRKHSTIGVNMLNKSNKTYVDKLSGVQGALDNNILRLERKNNQVKTVEQNKETVDKEIERIEQERRLEVAENNAIQDILLQKKKTIQTAFDELSDLSIKTNSEYDKLQENKSIKQFELEQAEIKLSLLRKFA